MGDVLVNGPDRPRVISPEEMAGQFQSELLVVFPDWKQRLQADPSCLNELEREVHAKFARGADLVVAGLLARVMKQPAFDEACEQTRRNYRHRLSRGRMRPMQIRLLGGLLIWVTSLYCARAGVGSANQKNAFRACTSNWPSSALPKVVRPLWRPA